MIGDWYSRWRYKVIPDHILGEVLAKDWIDNAVPFVFLILSLGIFSALIPGFFTAGQLIGMSSQLGELSLIAIAMTVVVLGGGIDLSVGATFALCNFVALTLVGLLEWPLLVAIPAVLAVGGLIGLLNGILIGYLRLRAFLTTLATLIVIRSVVELLGLHYAMTVAGAFIDMEAWDFIGGGTVLGIPFAYVVAIAVGIAVHLLLSRMRFGWHVLAVGGSRRSAHNAGISVRRTVCLTYVLSGVLSAAAGFFYAARLNSVSPDTGLGLEVTVLTAVVLGGISLGGGRGSVLKAMIGAIIVILVTGSLVRLNLPSGANQLVLGCILLLGVAFDIRWLKNRHKLLSSVYVSPSYLKLPVLPKSGDPASPYRQNERLQGVEAIGLGDLDGPEDMIFDSEDNMYTGSRHGDIIRFAAPNYQQKEVFAHIGGFPLGLAMDRENNLYTCVAGMGLYKVTPQREVIKLSDETNRSLLSVIDDSRIRLADDLDLAPDGRIFFSEATIRYEIHEWMIDALESRGNGRLICYDPNTRSTRTVLANLIFPNGICMCGDGESLLFAETWACRISRFWFDGPRKGHVEVLIHDLPGYPDNLNIASDGTFWCALAGMRTPAFDLASTMPGYRRRMARRVARDEWAFPNMNTGCVVRFDLEGRVLESLWDTRGNDHPQITSVREHKGYLYLGGISNNRIGRYKLTGADPNWTSQRAYWSKP